MLTARWRQVIEEKAKEFEETFLAMIDECCAAEPGVSAPSAPLSPPPPPPPATTTTTHTHTHTTTKNNNHCHHPAHPETQTTTRHLHRPARVRRSSSSSW